MVTAWPGEGRGQTRVRRGDAAVGTDRAGGVTGWGAAWGTERVKATRLGRHLSDGESEVKGKARTPRVVVREEGRTRTCIAPET